MVKSLFHYFNFYQNVALPESLGISKSYASPRINTRPTPLCLFQHSEGGSFIPTRKHRLTSSSLSTAYAYDLPTRISPTGRAEKVAWPAYIPMPSRTTPHRTASASTPSSCGTR